MSPFRKSGLFGRQSPRANQIRSAHGVEIHKHANLATICEDKPPPYSPSKPSTSYNMSAQTNMAGSDLEIGNLNQNHRADQQPMLHDDMVYHIQAVPQAVSGRSSNENECGGGGCGGCSGCSFQGPRFRLNRCGCATVSMTMFLLFCVMLLWFTFSEL
jgi:hypothetical protein